MSIAPYTIVQLDGQPSDLAAIAALYDRIWGQFNARTELREHRAAPGFTGRIARAPDSTLVGYAYGITAQPAERWVARVATYLAPEVLAREIIGSFFVTELAVAPEHQRRGLGAALMGAVLADCRHDRASIATEHYNAPSRALYERLGFTYLLEHVQFSPASTSPGDDFVIMRRALPLA